MQVAVVMPPKQYVFVGTLQMASNKRMRVKDWYIRERPGGTHWQRTSAPWPEQGGACELAEVMCAREACALSARIRVSIYVESVWCNIGGIAVVVRPGRRNSAYGISHPPYLYFLAAYLTSPGAHSHYVFHFYNSICIYLYSIDIIEPTP